MSVPWQSVAIGVDSQTDWQRKRRDEMGDINDEMLRQRQEGRYANLEYALAVEKIARKKAEDELAASKVAHDEALRMLASATDHTNSWARESGVVEANDEKDLKGVIDRLWSKLSGELADTQRQLITERERLDWVMRNHYLDGCGNEPPTRAAIDAAIDASEQEEGKKLATIVKESRL